MATNHKTIDTLPSPCFVCDLSLLEKNLKILSELEKESGVKILLALKGFAMYETFDLCKRYLSGCSASGLNEALLAKKYFGKELQTYSPAFKPDEIKQIAKISNKVIFNSFSQLKLNKKYLSSKNSIGLRINPEVSSVKTAIYDPCAKHSRLGITKMQFNMQLFEDENALNEVEGFHFHTLCEQNVDDFELVLNKFEIDFGNYFNGLKWLNFGGGHHMTKKSYKKEKFIQLMTQFRSRYPHLEIFFEPSEAIAVDTGILVSTVLDVVINEENIAILDTSAEAHMPDILAMPYTPNITNANIISNSDTTSQNRYILAGNTCLAGDIIGKYSFKNSLNVGDKIVFTDMIHYSMVKTTTFNGINLPSIAIKTSKGFKVLNNFGYNAYKSRL